MNRINPIPAGVHWVTVECPACGVDELVSVTIGPKLVRTEDESKLGIRATSKPRDHRCGQTTITVVGETGEILIGGEQS